MAALSRPSTLEVSNAISQLTVEETRQLVFQMGVQLKTLDDIAAQYDGENRKQHYVQAWLDMDRDASWEKLVAGLRKINKNVLATEIESEHLSSAAVASSTSPSLPSTSSPPASNTPANLLTTVPDQNQTSVVFQQRVAEVKVCIEHFEGEFADLLVEAQLMLIAKEDENKAFFKRFRAHLRILPVSKKFVHIKFFCENENEFKIADNVEDIFSILGRYCNYSNYEIIFHIVRKFCPELKGRMLKYRDSLTSFEKATTVDVYLCAISAPPGGKLREGFIRMTVKINKPPSECTLYEIREIKEAIEEEASLEAYSMYIETPGEGSVQVVLHVHEEVGWMVGVVFTLDFRRRHLLADVRIGEEDLREYLVSIYWKMQRC